MQTTAQALLNALDSPDSELSIVIIDDAEMAELNQTYRNRPGPTNVLAFPMHEGDFSDINPELLGDVVISIDTTIREAAEMGLTMEQRLQFLLIHGVLHLFGFDHETDDEAEIMDEKTEALFNHLGE
ncbi:MAG: rRNA maturation RNase YbeY [Desulfobacteraceae bacterium]|nr:MAG: rRNA maturation RNase YbeY [Desulfobacteraceae bacterium]